MFRKFADTKTPILAAMLLVVLPFGRPAEAFQFEMGPANLVDTFVTPTWTTITFLAPFDTVPHVYIVPTDNGGDPATIRIRNVTTLGFEAAQVEPSANDGPHLRMDTAYLAIEPGLHSLPFGGQISSTQYSTTSFANRLISTTWDNFTFPAPFSATPVILAGIQTVNNETGNPPATSSIPFMDVGIRNVTTTGLQSTLERAESTAGTVNTPEVIAILAVDNGLITPFIDQFGNRIQFQTYLTPNNIRGWDNGCVNNSPPPAFPTIPLAVASLNTRSGNNGGWVRRCTLTSTSIGLVVDEDIDTDPERNHAPETAGVVFGSLPFHVEFNVNLGVVKTVSVLNDPVNGGVEPRAIPSSTVQYTINVENTGSLSPDDSTVVILDTIPDDLDLCVAVTCQAGGPVIFDDSSSPIPTGVTLGTIEYSDDNGVSYSYTPTPDAGGFDPLVDAIRITMNGTLASISPVGAPQFDLRLAARVD